MAAVQNKLKQQTTSSTTNVNTLTSIVGTGNTIIVCLITLGSTTAPTSITDDKGNTYTARQSAVSSSDGNTGTGANRAWIYDSIGVTNGPQTITATWAAATTSLLMAWEESGITAYDTSSNNPLVGGTAISTSLTLTQTNDRVFGNFNNRAPGAPALTLTAPLTQDTIDNLWSNCNYFASGTYTGSGSQSFAGSWATDPLASTAVAAAYKTGAAGGGSTILIFN